MLNISHLLSLISTLPFSILLSIPGTWTTSTGFLSHTFSLTLTSENQKYEFGRQGKSNFK